MGRIGLSELLIILVIVIIVFGASRLPKVARGIGEGIREFRKAIKEKGSKEETKEEKSKEEPR